jgi:hypothetical protein
VDERRGRRVGDALWRRAFFPVSLPDGSGNGGDDAASSLASISLTLVLPLTPPALTVDAQTTTPNFLAQRHMRQLGLAPDDAPAPRVRCVRCSACGVYVGFAPKLDGEFRRSGSALGQPVFVSKEYVELVDGNGCRVTYDGVRIPDANGCCSESGVAGDVSRDQSPPQSPSPQDHQQHVSDLHHDTSIYCSTDRCHQRLFDKDDVLPWSHVLSSTLLQDMDAYLEYQHAWGLSRPALFVRRLKPSTSASPCSLAFDNVRTVPLRQGCMEVVDVRCGQCARPLGWKFLSEPVPAGAPARNYDQVGRYGVLRDAVRIGARPAITRIDLLPGA